MLCGALKWMSADKILNDRRCHDKTCDRGYERKASRCSSARDALRLFVGKYYLKMRDSSLAKLASDDLCERIIIGF